MPELGFLFGHGVHRPYFGSVLPRIPTTRGAGWTGLTVSGAGSIDVLRLVGYGAVIAVAVCVAVLTHKIAQGGGAFGFGFSFALLLAAALNEWPRRHRLRRA